ncbi:MAG: ribonuclease HII [Nanoarchaeota archaeon]
MLTLGIDDSGRGPVIGPMVLAGCLINSDLESEFKNKGIKDSKQLTRKRRDILADVIKSKAETFEIIIVHPIEIDGSNAEGTNLNDLEAITAAEIINRINKGTTKIKVVIDCPSPNIGKWRDFLKTKIKDLSNLEIVCEHKADINHIPVSAASILAKTTRDFEIEKIKDKIKENFGSGYASDPITLDFLNKHALKYQDAGIFRHTWSTWKTAIAGKEQKKIGEF